jgi:phosphoribosylanthranilate isomerase
VLVNADERTLNTLIDQRLVHILQLHGDETPQRVAEIAALMNLPVIKAVRLKSAMDVALAYEYEEVTDWLLFDSKIDHDLPGGTGQRFDWELLKGHEFKKPWMLSGGLTPEKVTEALKTLKPTAVDVSSGVEAERGIKDPAKIKAFIQAVKSAI